MSELVFLILGSASLGFSFAELSGIPQSVSNFLYDQFNIGKKIQGFEYVKTPLRLKPFDCGYCLSFWTGFLTTFLNGYADFILSLMVGFSASIIAVLLKKII